jgi:hypothetical protein
MDNFLRPAYGAFIVEIVFGEFDEIYSHRFLAVESYCQGQVNAVKAPRMMRRCLTPCYVLKLAWAKRDHETTVSRSDSRLGLS